MLEIKTLLVNIRTYVHTYPEDVRFLGRRGCRRVYGNLCGELLREVAHVQVSRYVRSEGRSHFLGHHIIPLQLLHLTHIHTSGAAIKQEPSEGMNSPNTVYKTHTHTNHSHWPRVILLSLHPQYLEPGVVLDLLGAMETKPLLGVFLQQCLEQSSTRLGDVGGNGRRVAQDTSGFGKREKTTTDIQISMNAAIWDSHLSLSNKISAK